MARVRGKEEVVGDFKKGCFGAVLNTESRLKWFEYVFGVEMGFELGSDYTFKYFGKKWLENGRKLFMMSGLRLGFFRMGVTAAIFSDGEEGVNDRGDEGRDDGESVVNEARWDGVNYIG